MQIMTLLLALAFCFFPLIQGANILILHPLSMKSQVAYLKPLADTLAERNHSVTVVSADENAFDENKMEVILVNDLKYESLFWETSKKNFMSDIILAHSFTSTNIRIFLESPQMRGLLQSNRTFDAVISSTYMFYLALACVPYRFNAIAVEFMPQASHPFGTMYTGNAITMDEGNGASFVDRVQNTWIITAMIMYNKFVMIPSHQSIVDDVCTYDGSKSMPPLTQLLHSKSLVLTNGHPTLSTPTYVSLVQKDVAGISIGPHSPVPAEYESFINKSDFGFIFLSWGSMLSSWDGKVGDTILDALSRIPYRVIWKCSRENFTRSIPKNVMVTRWAPQAALLGDKRIKVFLTHGGFSSMVETVNYGVPVIATPSSIDQPKNAAHMKEKGMGLVLSSSNFTADSLVWAINEVAQNSKYKSAAMELSKLFKTRMVPPMKEAVYWIEYSLMHKNEIKMQYNYSLPLFFIWNLDVFLMSIALFVFLVVSFSLVARRYSSQIKLRKLKMR